MSNRKKLAHEYLDLLETIRNLWTMGHDARHLDDRRKELYEAMLEETGKTREEYPDGRKLAYAILDDKV